MKPTDRPKAPPRAKQKFFGEPQQTESVLLRQCKYLLRILAAEGVLTWRRIHVTAVPIGGLKRFRRNVDMAGMPDLIVWIKGGPCVSIELKSLSGRQRDDQKAFQDELTKVGHPYWLIRRAQELDEILQGYGVRHWALGGLE